MVALALNTSETSTWDVLEGFPKLHSRAREVKTTSCTEAPALKSRSRVEIWLMIYESCDGLESFTRDPIGYRGSPWDLYELFDAAALTKTDAMGKRAIWCKGQRIREGNQIECRSKISIGPPPPGNGCGPKGWIDIIPDGDFSGPCYKHDDCYGTCGKSKNECDVEFLIDMRGRCDAVYEYDPLGWSLCMGFANNYGAAVYWFGNSSYENGQDANCTWAPCGGRLGCDCEKVLYMANHEPISGWMF